MNNYDRFVAVRAKLAQIHDAGYAVDNLRKRGAFTGAVEALAESGQPMEPPPYRPLCCLILTEEKHKLLAWEEDALKDERRAVKVLLADYFAIKGELETLLAAS